MRDPRDERREDKRRDDHLDQAQKEVGEDREIFGDFGRARRRVMRIDEPARRDARDHGKRSEEHTSELQSLMRISYAVFCLKNKTQVTLYVQTTQTLYP